MADKKYSWSKGTWKFLIGAALAWIIANFDNVLSGLPDGIEKILYMSLAGLLLMGLNWLKFRYFSKND